jgi:hypothetical protein
MIPSAPRTVQLAALLALLEAVAVAAFAVVELVSLDPDRPSVALTSGLFFLIYAAGLALAARGLLRLQTWSRSMLVMAQVIQLALAWSFRGGDTSLVAWLLGVPAVAALLLLLAPATTEALFNAHDEDEEDEESDKRAG